MEIFNVRSLSQKQRFNLAIILGIITSVVLGIATGYIRQYINFSMILWLIGYGLAMVIQKYGRGVTQKFSVLAAVLALVGILISDVVSIFGIARLFDPAAYQTVILFILNDDLSSIFSILHRFITIYIAYSYSRII